MNLISALLKGGMSCEKITLCIALGIVLGILPVIGLTSLLCVAAAFIVRLNLPIMLLVNYAVYPLQLILLAPFYVAGSRLFTGKASLYTGSEIVELLQNDLWGSIASLWDLTLYAVSVWVFISPMMVLFLYVIFKPVIRKLAFDQQSPLANQ